MLKVTKSIVNGQRTLIGFMIRGKESELGGFSSTEIERGFPIDNLISNKFCNNQLAIVNGKLVEKNNFKINQLPMCVYSPNNGTDNDYIDVDNTVDIIGRFVQDNENIGFRVKFSDGSENNLRYASLLTLCKWFKPGNFVIRSSALGKQYICGKKDGINLNELPATIIGKAPEVTPKRTKSAAKEKKEEVSTVVDMGFDILDIYDFIKDANGMVIKLPSEDYIAATPEGSTETEGFTSLGIGEVATPYPMFNATKLNVNANFKKVGVVPVNIGGNTTNITTFTHRTKSIFLDGENYMKKFGIAVPTETEEQLIKQLGASLALEKITDPSVISPLSQVIDAKSLSFYKVDSSKIDLIAEKKRKDSIMTAKQLANLCEKQYSLQLISKALGPKGGLMKELKASLGDDAVAKLSSKKLAGIFSMMSEEALEAVKAAGIDVYSGAYTVAGKPIATAKSSDGSIEKEDVQIEYVLYGFDASKLTGAKVIDAVKEKDATKVPELVIKYVSGVLEVTDPEERYKAAKKVYDSVSAKLDAINKQLWMHNASMFIEGGKARIHTHDADCWIPDASSRVKKATVFTSTKVKGLNIKFNGVSI